MSERFPAAAPDFGGGGDAPFRFHGIKAAEFFRRDLAQTAHEFGFEAAVAGAEVSAVPCGVTRTDKDV
jgi:hypothetical protein